MIKQKVKLIFLAFDAGDTYFNGLKPANAIFTEIRQFIKLVKESGTKVLLMNSGIQMPSGIGDTVESIFVKGDIPENCFSDTYSRMHIHKYNCVTVSSNKEAARLSEMAGVKAVGLGYDWRSGIEDCVACLSDIDVGALLATGRPVYPEAQEWSIEETEINPLKTSHWESLFGLSNGYLGIRGCHEEDDEQFAPYSSRGTFINGFFEYDGKKFIDHAVGKIDCSTIFPVCDWTRVHLYVDGEKFSFFNGRIVSYRRKLDMQQGILTRNVIWESPDGKMIKIVSSRFVCYERKHCAMMRYSVKPLNFSGHVSICTEAKAGLFKETILDSGASERFFFTSCVASGEKDKMQYLLYSTNNSGLETAMAFSCRISEVCGNSRIEKGFKNDTAYRNIDLHVLKDELAVIDIYACFYTSLETGGAVLADKALYELDLIGDLGYDRLLHENIQFWSNHWSSGDVEINGNLRDQQAVRFSLFHLRQAHPEDCIRSISATGNIGDNYRGHIFWDTEMFMAPYFNYTNPKLVRDLLMYRYNTIAVSREQTRKMGNPGVRYAWNTIDGVDNGGILYAAINQYHVNCDIVYAVWRYWISTQDEEFMVNFGAEMVFEISRFMFSIGTFAPDREGKFCVNMVCGPDEYHSFANNNCYTNAMLKFQFVFAYNIFLLMEKEHLRELQDIIARTGMKTDEPRMWMEAANRMYIPYNNDLGIHCQDDAYLSLIPVNTESIPSNYDLYADYHWFNLWRFQVSKQADVLLMMFTLGHEFKIDQKRANYSFYEPRTNHGSSLSPCIHSIVSAELGLLKESYDFLCQTLYLDLYDLKSNSKKGLHYACLGGAWMSIVNGLAGMRDYEEKLIFKSIIPDHWESYSFKLVYRGRLIRLYISRTEILISLLDGVDLNCMVNGKEIRLTKDKPTYQSLKGYKQ